MSKEILLEVRNLVTEFKTDEETVKAVNDVSFKLHRGETIGIVGESGSGKSVTALSAMKLIPSPPGKIVSGEIIYHSKNSGTVDLVKIPNSEMRKFRGNEIAMIFQEPMTSLNPVYTCGNQVIEAIMLHKKINESDAKKQAIELFKKVQLPRPEAIFDTYPHQISGGQKQRVMIAMAMSCNPNILIADEPTTALDVTIQAQILELIKKLKVDTGTSVILITHDLGVVAGMTDDIIVMYAGKVFEQAPTAELFAAPGNPYTKGLLKSVPDPAHEEGTELYQIPGLPPDVAHLPPGCPFAERCYRVEDICRRDFPPFVQLNAEHFSLCHFAEEVYTQSLAERRERDELIAADADARPSENPEILDAFENPSQGGTSR
ncbi:MAG: ABC transporter ATP-binding protein [Rubrivivax sp.]|nr:ABC transporter ATP-binding protein [Pyrinomonadaceae bacterium]